MATKIEWTEETWNPVTGCTKYSAGCEHCYAATFARRLKAMGNKRYINGFDVTVHRDLFTKPLEWKKSKMIFVNSMSDLFHEEVPEADILAIFDIMNKATNHTFQILTKRAKRLVQLSPQIKWTDNIWMGVSVENKATIYRCEELKKTGAKVKFVSAEPLLESISEINLKGIDWLIVGGESGPQSRKMEESWVVELKDLASQNNIPFFFKQWGGTNKKKTGSLLQGKQYKQYPKTK
ncbi:MAG: phage Gp37/Gp68 family protein [Clostridia bacterium]|nr:phage Gp37/Gp68 family protein [Clostridia bacterium]